MSAQKKDELLAEAVQLREQGHPEQARERLLALTASFPDAVDVAYQTAWVHDVLGLEAEAVPYYERSLQGDGLTDEDRRGRCSGSAAPTACWAGSGRPSRRSGAVWRSSRTTGR